MATTPTQLPVPSESPIDLKYNAGKVDEFVTSLVNTYADRFGKEHYTIEGLRWLAQQSISQFGYITLDSFEDGNTITLPNQVLRLEANGEYYRWDGALPKVVPTGSTPESTGGIGSGAWLSVGDAVLRSELASDVGDPLVSSHKVKAEPQGTLAEMQYYVTPEQFGAVGDGVAEDTIAVRAACSYAATKKIGVRGINSHTYSVSSVPLDVGLKFVDGLNLIANTSSPSGQLIYTRGPLFGGVSGHSLSIRNCTINCNGLTGKGILLNGASNSIIDGNTVKGISINGGQGIRIATNCDSILITNNSVTCSIEPEGTTNAYNCIAIVSEVVSEYGGIDVNGGDPSYPATISVTNVTVDKNTLTGGTHGVQVIGCVWVKITNNYITKNSHRNINLSPSVQRFVISNNTLIDAGSSAVNMALGVRWGVVIGNYIQSSVSTAFNSDDAAIQMNKDVDGVVVSSNTILGSWNYGIYINQIRRVKITQNNIQATTLLADIAMESDWVATVPAGAIYSKARTGVPQANTGASAVSITGNSMSGANCGIYIAAQNAHPIVDVLVNGNIIATSTRTHYGYFYGGSLMNSAINIADNHGDSPATNSKWYSDAGRLIFRNVGYNIGLEDGSIEYTTSGGTPSVFNGPNISITGTNTVTNFLDGYNGQTINVRLNATTTVVNNESLIRLKGAVNATPSDSRSILTLRRLSGIWFEVSRNF
ncbi:right-handed parallel beta-helix repeat-containing protein [Enterobacter cloacae]|uniref:tail fiber/spike domain-containing protein n=1 Tax=Enterobacter cloacae TaxID=550 RepID=UPI002FF64844